MALACLLQGYFVISLFTVVVTTFHTKLGYIYLHVRSQYLPRGYDHYIPLIEYRKTTMSLSRTCAGWIIYIPKIWRLGNLTLSRVIF
jgi:hypothetical protein